MQNANDIVIEHLRSIRVDLRDIKQDVSGLKAGMSAIEAYCARSHADLVVIHRRLDRQDQRIEGIGRRLDVISGEPR